MDAVCNNCGGPKPNDGYRACEACRAEWRHYARKPGGPAERNDALAELLTATKDVTRILEAVRYSAGLGKGQVDRLAKAQATIARVERLVKP